MSNEIPLEPAGDNFQSVFAMGRDGKCRMNEVARLRQRTRWETVHLRLREMDARRLEQNNQSNQPNKSNKP